MGDQVRIRQASLSDLDALVVLFDAYRRWYEQSGDLEAARDFLQARLEAGESTILMAFVGEQAAGFTQLYPIFSSVRMRRAWLLNDLYIAEAHRRSGAGRALLDHAAAWVRAQKGAYLLLETAPDNLPAQGLYENHGWQREEHFFYTLEVEQ